MSRSVKVVILVGLIVLVVCSIIYLMTPPLGTHGERSNERNAFGQLKAFYSIQMVFKTADSDQNGVNDYWVGDVGGLYYICPIKPRTDAGMIKMIHKEIADADAAPNPFDAYPAARKTAPYAGYWYKALPVEGSRGGRHPNRFALAAYPAEYTRYTTLTFVVSETGTIWKKDLEGKVINDLPRDPATQGWEKAD